MDKLQNFINVVLVGVVTFLLVDRFTDQREDYPLQNEVAAVEREFYLHYLARGEYPQSRAFLSPVAAKLVAAYPENFRWDEDGVFLHFTPRVEAEFVPSTIGKPGETFEHNCQVFKAHAAWCDGFRSDYEATPDELSAEGVMF
ncbi:hypothetical protein [Sulfuriroseicoccus oceanibius]|uniref:Uncharacterized protein n=1 Tax=Sulfuriroseicoccus oceanibius TaxID=2707525 RepID=A0A6B3LBA8_9BACT|nr:hypothetical protein [Sulfuriroseicoccus oceanibius]QQL43967.1 hypothetical protein G3M56_008670 [Sulfuriroseicoccus oceanibius]